MTYNQLYKKRAIKLRKEGYFYSEILNNLGINIPKSTLASWCKNIKLDRNYYKKLAKFNKNNIVQARKKALNSNIKKRREFINQLAIINEPISKRICDKQIAKIALSMLCLGEATKYTNGRRSFCLGSSNPKIIIIFMKLLKVLEKFNVNKVRCTVQCRADQNTVELEKYWRRVTKIPKEQFYRTRVDARTYGKPTLKVDYKGVLRVDYFDLRLQQDLECLSNIIYNRLV